MQNIKSVNHLQTHICTGTETGRGITTALYVLQHATPLHSRVFFNSLQNFLHNDSIQSGKKNRKTTQVLYTHMGTQWRTDGIAMDWSCKQQDSCVDFFHALLAKDGRWLGTVEEIYIRVYLQVSMNKKSNKQTNNIKVFALCSLP